MAERKTTDQFIQGAIDVHGDRYDYSLVDYINARTVVNINCNMHGTFKQSPDSHLRRRGCPKCAIFDSIKRNTKTTDWFIHLAKDLHDNRYVYTNTIYEQRVKNVEIICKEHGAFFQTPANHLSGCGCPKCASNQSSLDNRKSLADFIIDANKIHGNIYDYSQVIYVNNRTKIDIVCSKHGLFEQKPDGHLFGNGCPKCVSAISKSETKWLNHIGLPNDKEHRQVKIKQYTVDGYDPDTNTVYEFHGDYWHGNPVTTDHTKINPTNKKSFRQLYENTLTKEALIKDSGYTLVIMWENDWKTFLKSQTVISRHPSLPA